MSTETAPYSLPAWRVVLDGQDLTERMRPRLLDLTLTEARGGEADQLDLRIHDHDGRMALPRRGVQLSVALGWIDAGLVDKGTFRVDEVEHSGSPDVITVRARSADLTHPMRTRRERSWHQVTLGDVVRNLAGEHGLQARIAPALAGIAIAHLDQTGESDVHLLTRLGQRYDAVATVKAGNLVFMPIGSGTTAGGTPLPSALITRASGDRHRYSLADRETYSGVRAYWNNKPGANRKSVLVGLSGNAKCLRETYNSEAEAKEHANAEWTRIVKLHFKRPTVTTESREAADNLNALSVDSLSYFLLKAVRAEAQVLKVFAERSALYEARLRENKELRLERIIKNHAQMLALVDCVSLVVPLTDDMVRTTRLALHDMALERQKSISADHPIVSEFWEVYEYLEGLHEQNVVNHSRDPNTIAINLNEFAAKAAHHSQKIADLNTLRTLLRNSVRHKFIDANVAVNSIIRSGRGEGSTILKCWTFRK